MAARFVVLGLAQARSQWFRAVAKWSNTASIPVEFVKCVSVEELRARLAGGRPFSSLLLDAGLPTVDRDLIEAGRAAGCSIVIVEDARVERDWRELGADAVLLPVFDRDDLLDALQQSASPIARRDEISLPAGPADPGDWRAKVALVCGPGGTGASTVAIALAQGLGSASPDSSVLLADFCRRADQSMLHDSRDIVPGVQELVEAHRSGRPTAEDVRGLTYSVVERGYSLLLGMRRPSAWSAIRPRAFEAAIESLLRAFDSIVCDCEADFEGEVDGGSIDVEERNVMSRATAARADAVFVVGAPGMKGTHSLVRVIDDLVAMGVPSARIVPVINRGPRSGRARAETAAAIASLVAGSAAGDLASPVFLPERRIDDALRDGVPLPPAFVQPLLSGWRAALSRSGRAPTRSTDQPRKVEPGSRGAWAAHQAGGGGA